MGSELFRWSFFAIGPALLAAAVGAAILAARRTDQRTDVEAAVHAQVRRRLLPAALLAAVLSYWFLVAVDSELIHWLQFGALFLVFHRACGRPGEAALWTIVAGVVDESFQYWVDPRGPRSYFDFNDVVLNGVGAALGACLLLRLDSRSRHSAGLGAPASILVGLLALTTIGLFLGLGGLYQSTAPDAWFLLNRREPMEVFWTAAEWSNKRFHILSPVAGLICTALLLSPFIALDRWIHRLWRRADGDTV